LYFEGRVRGHRDNEVYNDQNVLSLNVISSHYIQNPDDERTFFRFEVAWDSSLHNSVLLNRVTPTKDWIYITITSYIEIENFVQPACITKDLSLIFYARDARVTLPRSLRSLLYGPTYKSSDSNKISGVYKLTVKQAADSASPGAHRRVGRVIDTASSYVRGEEMLQGWRPRSDSLIFEHQWEIEKLTRLQQVEKTKHFLLLKNTMDSINSDSGSLKKSATSSNIDKLNRQFSKAGFDEYETASYTDNQKQLLLNCLKLINRGRYMPSKISPAISMSRSVYDFASSSPTNANNNNTATKLQNVPNINVSLFYFFVIFFE
jgi:kinesin family protein 1